MKVKPTEYIFVFSSGNDKPEKIPEPVSTVAANEVPDVPNNSFLLRRSRTPSPVRKKRLEEAKNRFVMLFVNFDWCLAKYLGVTCGRLKSHMGGGEVSDNTSSPFI